VQEPGSCGSAGRPALPSRLVHSIARPYHNSPSCGKRRRALGTLDGPAACVNEYGGVLTPDLLDRIGQLLDSNAESLHVPRAGPDREQIISSPFINSAA